MVAPLKSRANSWHYARTPSVTLKAVFFIVLSVILMTMDHQMGSLNAFRQGLSVLVYPVRASVDIPFSAWRWLSESLDSRTDLLDINQQLRHEQLVLHGELQRFAALEEENRRLRELLDSSRQIDAEVQVAELLQADLDPFRHRVTINHGRNTGIQDGEAIIDANGVVGQVLVAGPISADAILITDPSHAIPVEINRNGVRTVALGTGSLDRLELPFLSNSADIQEGDLLITSGLARRFPRGYPVAVVDTIKRDPGQAFAVITARPVAGLERLREVLVIELETLSLPTPEAGETGETGDQDKPQEPARKEPDNE